MPGDTLDKTEPQVLTHKSQTPLMSRFIIFSLSLFLVILTGGSITFIFSMRQIMRQNKDNELSRMLEINRIQLERFVNSEIAIVLKMADSPLIKRYFANPKNPELEKAAFEEIASYRRAFSDFAVFWINDIDRVFYSDDNEPYWVDADSQDNYWYNMTLYETEVYNFNINYNPDIQQTRLWLNAPVFDDDHKPIGMVGTGIELSRFIDTIYQDISDRVVLYFFNAYGEISGAKDVKLVEEKRSIDHEMANMIITNEFGIVNGIDDGIFDKAKNLESGEIQTFDVPSGKIAIGSLPILEWYTVAFMPDSIDDYKTTMTVLFLVVLVIIFMIFIVFNLFIFRFLKSLQRTMESLEHAKIEAEQASRSKSSFLATMSHEIRTPMNAIIGIAQIQLQKQSQKQSQNARLPKEYASSLEKIYNSGNTLLGIINDILDMSKIETGRLELNLTEYDIPSLINDAVQLNLVRIGSKPVELILDIDKNLPLRLYGDELRLKQIFNNLLSNAIKYTERGSVKLSVNHAEEGADVMLRFVVEDTGQGMRNEDRERLFSEYLRFNAEANRATEGTGLGLSITRKLVEMMDGTIKVESEFGKGSTFTVAVKQKTVGRGVIGADLAERLRKFTFRDNRQTSKPEILYELMPDASVLVVDDIETNLFVAEGLLSLYKPKIETVISGFAAIEKVEGGKTYDIIFMDHMMPRMDGIETTKKLRSMGYNGVIVALTANALAGNDEMFIQNGFDSFLSKPIDMAELDETLKKWIPKEKREHETGTGDQGTSPKSISIPGVDVQRGIAMTGGKIELYRKVLAMFRKDVEKRLPLLQTTPNAEAISEFITQVHALKGASASIGAAEVSASAAELEAAGKAGYLALVGERLPDFAEQLAELVKGIDNALRTDTAVTHNETSATVSFVSLLRKLDTALQSQKADDIDRILEELMRLPQTGTSAFTGTKAALEQISDEVLMAEYDRAGEILAGLLGRVSGE